MPKVKIIIDGRQILAEEGSNLLETARVNGIEIPSLCHDPRLEPFGACRQCLVEVEGARGLVQACGAQVRDGMIVRTNTENIINLRRLGLELLLTEHCGDCIAPCQLACPAKIDIQGFIAHIANGQLQEAAKLIREKLPLPASIGRVCPRFCEKDCRRNLIDGPVSICFLKRYAGDAEMESGEVFTPSPNPDTGKQVAVIGGGPAGLAAAYYLALAGHRVTIFEAEPQLGGMMRYGIPEYRLPNAVLDKEIKVITNLCQDVYYNKKLGRDFTIRQLKLMGFDAVFVGIGSWSNQALNIPGEDLRGVYSGIEFLGRIAMDKPVGIGHQVVVIGGGNTAMDAARSSVRLGASEVTVVYRRSREEMPASPHEVTQAEEEGVNFQLLTAPVEFIGDSGRVTAIKCVKMQLGEPDRSGRRRPVPVPDSEFVIPADMVITATGQKLDKSSTVGSPELSLNKWGDIDTNLATMQCGIEWLFSAGDCATGPATAVEAIAAGRKAAESIIMYLNGEPVTPVEEPFNCTRGPLDHLDAEEFADRERILRAVMPTLTPAERKNNFKEFELGFTAEMAVRETDRCLSCGCLDVFSCRLREYATKVRINPDRLGFGKLRFPVLNEHPYIVRDLNKCILCGNCVRVCQEIQGIGALGFVNRGSQTVVLPSLKYPLSETLCNSCGQCTAICPTGALVWRSLLSKPGPWETRKVESVCSQCNIGCKFEYNVAGGKIAGVTSPVNTNTVNEGELCVKCAFGHTLTVGQERLCQPLVGRNGRLVESSWDEALNEAGSILKEIMANSGLDSIAVMVSPKQTNEENLLAYKLGRMALGTNNIFSTVPVATSEIASKAMRKRQSPSFKELLNNDLILAVGGDVSDNYPIVAHKIKKAVAKGSNLMIIGPDVTSLHALAKYSLKINNKKLPKLLQTFLSYILRYNLVNKESVEDNMELMDELNSQIPEDFYDTIGSFRVKPDKIINMLHYYIRAKNPAIIVDGRAIEQEALELLSIFTLITGSFKPGCGLMTLYPEGNIQGQLDIGIKAGIRDYRSLVRAVAAGTIRGLVILNDGSPIDRKILCNGMKTVVITPKIPIGYNFDVVLPGAVPAECSRLREVRDKEVEKLVNLYRQVFDSYPSPLLETAYVRHIMKDKVYFLAVFKGDRLISAGSAEIDFINLNAEITDLATDKEARGMGLATIVISALEKEMWRRKLECLFSLARAGIPGVNRVFYKLGYQYRGRMINNCHIGGRYEDMNLWVKPKIRSQ